LFIKPTFAFDLMVLQIGFALAESLKFLKIQNNKFVPEIL
jgi:hypothetical protein